MLVYSSQHLENMYSRQNKLNIAQTGNYDLWKTVQNEGRGFRFLETHKWILSLLTARCVTLDNLLTPQHQYSIFQMYDGGKNVYFSVLGQG